MFPRFADQHTSSIALNGSTLSQRPSSAPAADLAAISKPAPTLLLAFQPLHSLREGTTERKPPAAPVAPLTQPKTARQHRLTTVPSDTLIANAITPRLPNASTQQLPGVTSSPTTGTSALSSRNRASVDLANEKLVAKGLELLLVSDHSRPCGYRYIMSQRRTAQQIAPHAASHLVSSTHRRELGALPAPETVTTRINRCDMRNERTPCGTSLPPLLIPDSPT
jgi:hypothetical protein